MTAAGSGGEPLPAGAVDVWLAAVAELKPHAGAVVSLTVAAERGSAARPRVLARGLLRLLLSRYTGVAPRDHRIAQACGRPGCCGRGRPRLAAGGPGFSVSYGGSLIAFAFSGCDAGVDLEPVDRDVDWRSVGPARPQRGGARRDRRDAGGGAAPRVPRGLDPDGGGREGDGPGPGPAGR